MGYFTIYNDERNECDVDIHDILSNINTFSKEEINDLYDAIIDRVDNKDGYINDYTLKVDNLYDYYKLRELKKIFNKYSLEDLEKLNK